MVLNLKNKIKNEVVIYWSYGDENQIRAEKPCPVIATYLKDKDLNLYQYARCPSFIEIYNNTFGLKSLFSWDITFNNNNDNPLINPNNFTPQDFLNKQLFIRDLTTRTVSITIPYFFLTREDSLEMEYMTSGMENNSFNETAILINGKLDIGQYARTLDCAWHARKNEFKMDVGDIYAYVKFRTDKKIIFKQFLWNNDIQEAVHGLSIQRGTQEAFRNFKPLKAYYKEQQRMKVKERTLKLIEENLL